MTTPEAAVAAARAVAPGLANRAEKYDRDGTFPAEDFAELRGAGLLGLMVPLHLGGAGARFADYAEVAMTLGAGNGATALVFNMHASVTGALALTPDDVARALGATDGFFAMRDSTLRAASLGAFYAVAMSERRAGSRLSAVETTYEPVDGGWHIRGEKTFCSGAGHADGYLVAARRDDKVSYFLVPASDGVKVVETWDSLGMRATASHDLLLDTVVPEEALIGGVEGLALLLAQVMPQWLVASYAAVYVGVAQSAVDAAVAHVNERDLARLPAVRARLGRADAQVAAAREVVRVMAHAVDEAPGEPATNRWVWRAKLLAGETAMDVAASLLEACGTSATRRGHPLERIYRDARCGSLQPATSDVCADWLGLRRSRSRPRGRRGAPMVRTAVSARIAGIGSALPTELDQQELWDEFFAAHYAGHRTARRIWRSSGVRTRHGVLDPRVEDVSRWGTQARMERYVVEALPLGKGAVGAALDNAGVRADEVGMFVVASCTGYATPGLDILLARDLGMDPGVQRLGIGHMGCYAAVPGLGAVTDFVARHGGRRCCCASSCPACTCSRRPTTCSRWWRTRCSPTPPPRSCSARDARARARRRRHRAAHRTPTRVEMMTWDVTDLGFRMGLSPEVPDVLARHVRPGRRRRCSPATASSVD